MIHAMTSVSSLGLYCAMYCAKKIPGILTYYRTIQCTYTFNIKLELLIFVCYNKSSGLIKTTHKFNF